MTLPGVEVERVETPASSSPPLSTGTAFFVGLFDRGATDEYLGPFRNVESVVEATGDRASYGYVYDAADVYFREGGNELYLGRIVGPTPVKATVNLDNASNVDTLKVEAKNPGSWGNGITVGCTLTAGSFVLTVTYDGEVVETLPSTGSFADNTEAVAYAAASSDWIILTDLGQGDPKTQSLALASGADDRNNITTTQIEAALALFTKDLGPGQVCYPGGTTAAIHAALLNHAEDNNRFALLDYADTGTASTITTAAATDRALTNPERGAGFTPWVTVPGVTFGTERTVPPSAVIAGLCARNDVEFANPNVAPAGRRGISAYATGVSQDAFDNGDREDLNDAGVNVLRILYGQVRNYGIRTLADPESDANYREFPAMREVMAVEAEGDAIMEDHFPNQIDGNGIELGSLNGDLAGMLLEHYGRGALYGETPEEAFRVITDAQVNPTENLEDGIVTARLAIKVSPHAERLRLEIQKTPITDSV